MDVNLASLHFGSILLGGLTYFILGSFWFSKFFGKKWVAALKKQHLEIRSPSRQQMRIKIVTTFVLNVLMVLVQAIFLRALHAKTLTSAVGIGLLASIGWSATGMAIAYNWQSRPLALFLIDYGYHCTGMLLATFVLMLWQ